MTSLDFLEAPGEEDQPPAAGPHIVYYDEPLDQAHDQDGFSHDPDSSGSWEHLYAVHPTLIQRLRWHTRGVIYLAAFVLPMILMLIPLVIWSILDGDSSSDTGDSPLIAPQWPAEVDFEPHTVPAMIKNDLPLAGMKQGYIFRGKAGQVWEIIVEPREGSTLDPQITLYTPSGGVLAQNDSRSVGEITAALTIPLTENGHYRLLVESAQGGLTTGGYLLTLFEG
ncbi:MAG: hypothetical protein HY866_15575 [Chloroflexi bacterium]|nr:hypothetical protein [Chloroflexota bacterium]